MRYRIEFTEDMMHVLDDENYGYDAFIIQGDNTKDAEAQIDEWAAEYGIDPRPAKRYVRNLIRRM